MSAHVQRAQVFAPGELCPPGEHMYIVHRGVALYQGETRFSFLLILSHSL